MPDWDAVFSQVYASRIRRKVTFKRASGPSGSGAAYAADRHIEAGVEYRTVGFDPQQGVFFPRNEVELQIWLRDWFERSADGASDAELLQLVIDLKGQVREGDRETWSRFVVDGVALKYDRHRFDQRPDGILFSVIVTVRAA